MTRVMPPDTALARFCREYYGTVKAASDMLEIPYQTLCNNCRRPARGWKYVDKMVERFMGENQKLREKVQYLNDQYSMLAKEYNRLVDKYEALTKGEVL